MKSELFTFLFVHCIAEKLICTSESSFTEIRLNGYLYVDKTDFVARMISERLGRHFMSRPRKFGKSLMISTMAEALGMKSLEEKLKLFRGTWIAEHRSDLLKEKHQVICLDFANVSEERFSENLLKHVSSFLPEDLRSRVISVSDATYDLIHYLSAASPSGKMVILVDEYDAPLVRVLDNDENGKFETLNRNRTVLKQFFSVIKANGPLLRYVWYISDIFYILAFRWSFDTNFRPLVLQA